MQNEFDDIQDETGNEFELSWGELICILLLGVIFACGIPALVVYYTLMPK